MGIIFFYHSRNWYIYSYTEMWHILNFFMHDLSTYLSIYIYIMYLSVYIICLVKALQLKINRNIIVVNWYGCMVHCSKREPSPWVIMGSEDVRKNLRAWDFGLIIWGRSKEAEICSRSGAFRKWGQIYD